MQHKQPEGGYGRKDPVAVIPYFNPFGDDTPMPSDKGGVVGIDCFDEPALPANIDIHRACGVTRVSLKAQPPINGAGESLDFFEDEIGGGGYFVAYLPQGRAFLKSQGFTANLAGYDVNEEDARSLYAVAQSLGFECHWHPYQQQAQEAC